MILLSIVTIAYNNLLGLRTTIDSIDKYLLEYSKLGYVEHIIIDGNSIDGTKSFLREFSFCREVSCKLGTNVFCFTQDEIIEILKRRKNVIFLYTVVVFNGKGLDVCGMVAKTDPKILFII